MKNQNVSTTERIVQELRDDVSMKLFGRYELRLTPAEDQTLDEFIKTTIGMNSDERDNCIKMITDPEWKEHPDYYALFSSDGKHVLDSRDKHPLTISINPDGYPRVHVKSRADNEWKSIGVHRAIGELFVENDDPEHKIRVHHINGNKECNWPWNLKWVTLSEHTRLHFELGSRPRGSASIFSKTREDVIERICRYLKFRPDLTFEEVGKIVGTTGRIVQHVYDGTAWNHISRNYTPFPPRETDFKRGSIGDQNPAASHTEEEARLVCVYLSDPDYQSHTYEEIAKLCDVDRSFASMIGGGNSWTHVAEDYNILPRLTDSRRGARGINNGATKYSLEQIRKICDLLEDVYERKIKMSHQEIANTVHVDKQCVDTISCCKMWKTVSETYPWYQARMKQKELKYGR